MLLPSRRRKCVIYGETNNHAVVFAHVVCPNAHQGRLFAPKAPTVELPKFWSFMPRPSGLDKIFCSWTKRFVCRTKYFVHGQILFSLGQNVLSKGKKQFVHGQNVLSMDKLFFFLWTKCFVQGKKQFVRWTKRFIHGQSILSEIQNVLSMDKMFCPLDEIFCPWTKRFVQG